MSKKIDLDKPLSEEDRQYLLDRDRHRDVEYADGLAVGGESEKAPEGFEFGSDEWVDSLNVGQLKEELAKRNVTEGLSNKKRPELVDMLYDALEAEQADEGQQ